jgi:hypothetical protein
MLQIDRIAVTAFEEPFHLDVSGLLEGNSHALAATAT